MADVDVDAAYRFILNRGVGALPVGDVCHADLEQLTWSGSASHLRNMAAQLDRVARGEVAYQTVRLPTGESVAKGGVDFAAHPDAGMIFQLATRDGLEGLGLASRLIAALEDRIRERGLTTSCLSVEPDNLRALRLYEYLGYRQCGHSQASWEAEGEDGSTFVYQATLVDLKKDLN
jgi:ribosomal protein S18 acetylase RimI-like enzyme